MKGVEMLVVSFRGVNFGFWSPLGCSGQNTRDHILPRRSRFGLHAKKYKNIYLICIFLVSFTGGKKLGPRSNRSPLGV